MNLVIELNNGSFIEPDSFEIIGVRPLIVAVEKDNKATIMKARRVILNGNINWNDRGRY